MGKTIEEKRQAVQEYCRTTKCKDCKLNACTYNHEVKFEHMISIGKDVDCLNQATATDEEIKQAYRIIKGKKKKVFDWDAFCTTKNQISVNCKTLEQAQDFLEEAEKHGLKADLCSWNRFKKSTCYGVEDGYLVISRRTTLEGKVDTGYKILKWKPYMQEEPVKEQKPEKDYPKLTAFQHKLLEEAVRFGYEWIARDRDKRTYFYSQNPGKSTIMWNSVGHCDKLAHCLDTFSFVKWEDTEPWNLKELLENCEVCND